MTIPMAAIFSADNDTWFCRGALTLNNAAAALKQSESLPLPASGVVDFGETTDIDSTALAVMLALVRRAQHEHKTLAFRSVPSTLQTLAHVYGIDELFSES
jgi:Predicted NTP binding protein (contains STAS domain)